MITYRLAIDCSTSVIPIVWPAGQIPREGFQSDPRAFLGMFSVVQTCVNKLM